MSNIRKMLLVIEHATYEIYNTICTLIFTKYPDFVINDKYLNSENKAIFLYEGGEIALFEIWDNINTTLTEIEGIEYYFKEVQV